MIFFFDEKHHILPYRKKIGRKITVFPFFSHDHVRFDVKECPIGKLSSRTIVFFFEKLLLFFGEMLEYIKRI